MVLLGAHLSIAGGYQNALLLAGELKCNCVQIFVKNQRQWKARDLSAEEISLWKQTREACAGEIVHVIAHSAYLINLAGDPKIRELSIRALADELGRCDAFGIDRLVLHPGSHRGQGVDEGIRRVVQGLDEVVKDFPKVKVLLETTAGAGNCLGGTIEEISEIIQRSKYPEQLGCCLDTCHLFAAGYAFCPRDAFDELVGKISSSIGIDRIGCIHLNDSCGQLGSHLDRHAHIGEGFIGVDAFRYILTYRPFDAIPKCIETPKSSDESLDFDRKNLHLLRELAEKNE